MCTYIYINLKRFIQVKNMYTPLALYILISSLEWFIQHKHKSTISQALYIYMLMHSWYT